MANQAENASDCPQIDDPKPKRRRGRQSKKKGLRGLLVSPTVNPPPDTEPGWMLRAIDPLQDEGKATPEEQHAAESKRPVMPLSLREEAFIPALITRGGDERAAAEDVGFERRHGKMLLENPIIKARLADAAREAWLTPDAIMSRIGQFAFSDSIEPRDAIKALELAGKARALFVENIRTGNLPRTTEELDRQFAAELQRVFGTGEVTPNVEALLNHFPALPAETQALTTPETDDKTATAQANETPPITVQDQKHIQEAIQHKDTLCSNLKTIQGEIGKGEAIKGRAQNLRGVAKRYTTVAKCHTNEHRRVSIRPQGWICACGAFGHGDPVALEAQLQEHGYTWDGQAYVKPSD